jgi:hypothetical protein
MNIKYHIACGVVLDIVYNTKGVMTLYSILPDTPLLLNEYKLFKYKLKFNEWAVSNNLFTLYKITHSLFILPFIYWLSPLGCIAYTIHQIADWFTHTGRFSSVPFYPFPYTITFGRNILK